MADCFDVDALRAIFSDQDIEAMRSYDLPKLEKTINDKINDIDLQKKHKYLQTLAVNKLIEDMPEDPKQIQTWLNGLNAQNKGQIHSNRAALETRANAKLAIYHQKMADFMAEAMPTRLGLKTQRSTHEDIVRVLFGEDPLDPSNKVLATQWLETTDLMRREFNKAGGGIPPRKGVPLPQIHIPEKVSAVPYEVWYNDIMNSLDYELMGITRPELEEFIKDIYYSITTDGLINLEPGKIPPNARGKIGNRHREARFFEFKNAESWLAYNKKYGNNNIYAAMMDETSMMSKEIAAMELYGPNPDLGFKYIVDTAKQRTAAKGKPNPTIGSRATKEFNQFMGYTSPLNRKVAHTMSSIRNVLTAIHLPAATLSAIPDVWYSKRTLAFNGMESTMYAKRMFANMARAATDRKQFTRDMGRLHLGLEHAMDAARTASRYADVVGQGASAHFAEGMIRASGLNFWTVVQKATFGQFMLEGLSATKFNQRTLAAFKRYGITDADIEALRKAPRISKEGIKYVDLAALKPEVAEKFAGMIQAETRMAVPEADLRTRAFMTQAERQGSVAGEFLRSMGQFSTFPIQVMLSHWSRALGEATGGQRIAYIANLAIGLTILGAMSIQAKELSKGREAMDWEDPQLWKKGFIQGGTLGIIGDLLFSDVDRYGYSTASQVGGPLMSDINKYLAKGLLGAAQDFASGDMDKAYAQLKKTGGEFVTDAMAPANLWYTRLIFDRMMDDQIKKMTNPNWYNDFRASEARRLKEYDNEYYWGPSR